MAITASVGTGDPGRVLIVLPGADLTDGDAWTLTGSAGDDVWQVRGGSGTGDGATQVALIDPMCPVNTTVTYTLTVAGVVSDTDTVTRTYTGTDDLLSSLDGGTLVSFVRLASGGDRRQGEARFHATVVPGRSTMPLRLAPVAGVGGGSLTAQTDHDNTVALRSLLLLNLPVVLFHNPSTCQSGCTVPLTELVYLTGWGNDVLHAAVSNKRVWDLSYLVTSDPEPGYRVPLSTWGDVEDADLTWGEAATAVSGTWGDAEILDWSTVGA